MPAGIDRGTAGRKFFLGALLAVLTVLVYLPSTRCGFIWDDDCYVTDNQCLESTEGLKQIWLNLKTNKQYYPLVFTSFWIEHFFFGHQPLVYHFNNILLHAANAVLLWMILGRLRVPFAWIAAAVFALHPINVETVAWITERKNLLSAFFSGFSLLAYFRVFPPAERRDGTADFVSETGRTASYFLSLAFFSCALFSKTVTAVLPVVILILFWWRKKRIESRQLLTLLPFFVFSGLAATVTIVLEKGHAGACGPPWDLTFVERILIAGRALWFYAAKLFWPDRMIFIYPRWSIDVFSVWPYLFPLGFMALLAALWWGRRRLGRAPLVAVLVYAVILSPALGFINFYPMRYSFVADHFQYLAGIPLVAMAVGGLGYFSSRRGKDKTCCIRALCLVLLLVLGFRSWQEQGKFQSAETLWKDTLAKNKNCWMAWVHMGNILAMEKREVAAAEQHFRTALEIAENFEAHINLGHILEARGAFAAAEDHYEQALKRLAALNYPGRMAKVYKDLAEINVKKRDYGKAVLYLSRMAEIRPEDPDVQYFLGMSCYAFGDSAGARKAFKRALSLRPEHEKAARMLRRLDAAKKNL